MHLNIKPKLNKMKTNRLLLFVGSIFLSSLLILSSCRKKEDEQDNDTSSASENAYAEGVLNDISSIGDQAGWNNNGNSLNTYRNGIDDNAVFLISCVDSIVRDTTSATKKITVYFGNRLCQDGRIRSGALKFSYTNGQKYRDSGVVISVTPLNYVVDGYSVSGTKTITNLGRINGNFRWSIVANISLINLTNGGIITYACNRTKELLNTATVYNGPSLPINWANAKIGITGSANGNSSNGNSYSAIIQTQLVRDFTCAPDPLRPHRHPFISGVVDFTPGSKPKRTVNFGNGTCDMNATVTVNGNTYNFVLR